MRVMLVLLLALGAAQAQELSGTLLKIRDTGRIGLGIRDRSLPFGYLDGAQPIGYGIDVCLRVAAVLAQELGIPPLRVDMRPVQSVTRFALLADGTIDLDCGTTSNTVERQRQAAFSNTYFLTTARYVSRRADGLHGIEALRGRTVAATANTTNLAQLRALDAARQLDLKVQVAEDTGTAFRLFASGSADAFVADDVLLSALVAASDSPAAYVVGSTALSPPEPYAIMLRRDDAPLKAAVDRATAALLSGPDGPALYAKWFQLTLPGRGINLDLPMSPGLQRAFQHPTDSADPIQYGP